MYRTTSLSKISPSSEKENEFDRADFAQSRPTTWIPISLRTSSLIGFIILFTTLGLGLVLLYILAKRSGGFDLLFDNHYAWMYGPTAVLILVISLWRQVDYNCRILTPWEQLVVGNKDAKSTIFLDYVSPFQLVTFYQAVANGHVPVVLTTLGFFVLKLAAIASTGLLVVLTLPIAIPDSGLLITTEFNYTRASYVDIGTNLTSALYRAYGYLLMDMPFADGVTASSAYQSVSLPSGIKASNTTYGTRVQSFSPLVDCQRVDVSLDLLDTEILGGLLAWNFSITTPCNITQNLGWTCKPGASDCPSSEFQFFTVPTDCGIPDQSWLFLSYGLFLHSQTSNDSDPNAYSDPSVIPQGWSVTPANDSSWMCKIDYEMHKGDVLYEPSPNTGAIQLGAPTEIMTSSIPGLYPVNLTMELYWGFRSSRFDDNGVIYLSNSTSRVTSDPLIGIMKQMVNATENTFTQDPDSMGPVAETVIRQVASQIVAQVAMQPANISTSGSIFKSEARLHINVVVLGFMTGCLFIMIGLSAALFWVRPVSGGVFQRPDTIKNAAALLAGSDKFRMLLDSINELSEKMAMTKSRHVLCSADLDASHRLRLQTTTSITSTSAKSPELSQDNSGSPWWAPLTLKKPIVFLSVFIPVICVGVLEVLQRLSDRHHGFVELHPSTSQLLESVYTRFLPALIMLLIATLATSLDFNAAALAPFDSLRRDHSNSFNIIGTSVLGKLPPLALFHATKQRQWSSAFAAIAAFISSILTIIVSGLYTVDNVTASIPIDLMQQGLFQLKWDNSVMDDGGAAVILSLIESVNLTQPAFTYDELVFPTLSLTPDSLVASANSSGMIEIWIPALRANLDCHDYYSGSEWSLLNISRVNNWAFGYSSSVPLPSGCWFGGPYANESTIKIRNSWTISPAGNDGKYYVAGLQDLHVGPYPYYYSAAGELDHFNDNPPGCPSLALSWGWADTSRNVSSGVSAMVCNQQIQQVSTRLTLTYPNLTIPASHPPYVNESDVQVLTSRPNNATAFPFRIQNSMAMTFSLFNQSGTSRDELSAKRMLYDGFFTGVIFGKNQLGSNFQVFDYNSRDKFMGGISSFYRRYMAQVINAKMRVPVSTSSDESNRLSATISIDSGAFRIVQHHESKVILQAMLSAMFLIALLSLYFGTFHSIVPWNPCSIAGTAVLFSGSKMYQPLRSSMPSHSHGNADQESVTVTEIEDTNEGTPLIGCDPDRDTQHDTSNEKATPIWESFSVQNRNSRAKQRALSENQSTGVDLRTARLRLGWWRDGVFYGGSGPTKREMEVDRENETRSWRYGIDCLSSQSYDA